MQKNEKTLIPPPKPAKTYVLGRVCLYCGEPIEDQARASRLYCLQWVDEFGIRHDCKRRQHQLKHQLTDALLLDLNAKQREIARQIERMIKAHGDEVPTDALEAYGINLFESISFELNSSEGRASFLGFTIITNSATYKHKIIKT